MKYEDYTKKKKKVSNFPYGDEELVDWYYELELALDTVYRLIHACPDNPLMVDNYKAKFPEPPAVIMGFLTEQLYNLSKRTHDKGRLLSDWPKCHHWESTGKEPLPEDNPSDTGC